MEKTEIEKQKTKCTMSVNLEINNLQCKNFKYLSPHGYLKNNFSHFWVKWTYFKSNWVELCLPLKWILCSGKWQKIVTSFIQEEQECNHSEKRPSQSLREVAPLKVCALMTQFSTSEQTVTKWTGNWREIVILLRWDGKCQICKCFRFTISLHITNKELGTVYSIFYIPCWPLFLGISSGKLVCM